MEGMFTGRQHEIVKTRKDVSLRIKRQDARSGIVCVARNDSGNDENIKLTPFVVEERSLEH